MNTGLLLEYNLSWLAEYQLNQKMISIARPVPSIIIFQWILTFMRILNYFLRYNREIQILAVRADFGLVRIGMECNWKTPVQ
jgi:hypothetical protein